MSTLLDILIPTYNRAVYLEKNIQLLLSFIEQLNIKDKVKIIVSNNASTDNTAKILKNFNNDNLIVYTQKINLGLEKNAVYCLSKSNAKFCMFLGDDDYIDILYLKEVIQYIKNYTDITCVIPSITSIDINGNHIKGSIGRDLNNPTKIYKKGLETAQKLFQKGHQLSGVTFLREETLETYLNSGYRNIYLFMYFVGFNCLRGDTVHLTQYPVKVTQPLQENKDWGYGDDGLIPERLKNCHAIFKGNKREILKAEKFIIMMDRGFGYRYLNKGIKCFLKYIFLILKTKNCSLQAKIYFLSIASVIFIKYYLINNK